MCDRASKALVEASLLGEPRTYNATSKHNVSPCVARRTPSRDESTV
jgi:hypothetical protein